MDMAADAEDVREKAGLVLADEKGETEGIRHQYADGRWVRGRVGPGRGVHAGSARCAVGPPLAKAEAARARALHDDRARCAEEEDRNRNLDRARHLASLPSLSRVRRAAEGPGDEGSPAVVGFAQAASVRTGRTNCQSLRVTRWSIGCTA